MVKCPVMTWFGAGRLRIVWAVVTSRRSRATSCFDPALPFHLGEMPKRSLGNITAPFLREGIFDNGQSGWVSRKQGLPNAR